MNAPPSSRPGDAGVTLAELVVVLMMLGLVGSLVTTMVVVTTRNVRATEARTTDARSARVAVDAMTRLLRVAVPEPSTGGAAFLEAGPSEVAFYARRDPGAGASAPEPPMLVRYAAGSGQLTESVTPPTANPPGSPTPWSWDPAGATTRVLARGLVDPQPPIFGYAPAVGDSGALPTEASGALTTLARGRVRSVTIHLELRTPTQPVVPATTVVGRVALSSLCDVDGKSSC